MSPSVFRLFICLFGFCALLVIATCDPPPPEEKDIPEECRFRPPPPDQTPQICCAMPGFLSSVKPAFDQCLQVMRKNLTAESMLVKNKGNQMIRGVADDGHPEGGNGQPPSKPSIAKEMIDCVTECVFNSSGFLTPDGSLNEDALSQKLNDDTVKDSTWAPIAPKISKKCIADAKEAGTQKTEGCKAAPAAYMKCMGREAFLNCPSEIWSNNQECNDIKSRLERCPNLPPPPQHRPAPPVNGN